MTRRTLESLLEFYWPTRLRAPDLERRSLDRDTADLLRNVGLPPGWGSPPLDRIRMLPPSDWQWHEGFLVLAQIEPAGTLLPVVPFGIFSDGRVGPSAAGFGNVTRAGSSLRAFLHCSVIVEEAFMSVLNSEHWEWPPHWLEAVEQLLADELEAIDGAALEVGSLFNAVFDYIGPG